MANLIYDNFKVHNRNQLNCEDMKSLTLLYLPLMGIDSYAVYSILMSLDYDELYSFKKILDLLNFKNINLFNKAIDKLEGLGLVQSYYSENKGYLFTLFQPLSFTEFFDNELLSGLLETQIGEVEFKNLAVKQKPRIIGYKNITKKFNEVFTTSERSAISSLKKIVKDSLALENKAFNYSLFKILFDASVLSEDVLNDAEFKKRIERISFLYKLNEEEMRNVVIKTIDVDKNLEYASIAKNAKYLFQEKYKANNPRIESLVEDQFIPSTLDDSWRDLLNAVENYSIVDVLQSLSGIKPAASEVAMFEKLQENTKFPTSVINLMIYYVNAEKGGELPGYNYFEKIANTWARMKVKNAYDALKYITDEKPKANDTKTNKPKKQVKPLPDWYSEYTSSLSAKEEKVQEETTDKSEIVNLVKDMFK